MDPDPLHMELSDLQGDKGPKEKLNSVKSAAAICIGNLTEVMYVE
jgi:hypothetical protein